MKRILALTLALMMALTLLAGCGSTEEAAPAVEAATEAAPAPAQADEVTWADYQAFLKETFADKSPDPEGFSALVDGLSAWEDIDLTTQPWSKLLADDGFDGSTWDEFVAAGGVGTYNADYADDTSVGANEGSGEPSGEPSSEPAAE